MNKYSEAEIKKIVDRINYNIKEFDGLSDMPFSPEDLNILLYALEKQLPKDVIHKQVPMGEGHTGRVYFCPDCHVIINKYKLPTSCECGQALVLKGSE